MSRWGFQQIGSRRKRRTTRISIALAPLLLLSLAVREKTEKLAFTATVPSLLRASFFPPPFVQISQTTNQKGVNISSIWNRAVCCSSKIVCKTLSARFTPILLIVTLSPLPSSLWFPPPFTDTSSAPTTVLQPYVRRVKPNYSDKLDFILNFPLIFAEKVNGNGSHVAAGSVRSLFPPERV